MDVHASTQSTVPVGLLVGRVQGLAGRVDEHAPDAVDILRCDGGVGVGGGRRGAAGRVVVAPAARREDEGGGRGGRDDEGLAHGAPFAVAVPAERRQAATGLGRGTRAARPGVTSHAAGVSPRCVR